MATRRMAMAALSMIAVVTENRSMMQRLTQVQKENQVT
jgi:hypothetical protein